jgi:hypothetical protein
VDFQSFIKQSGFKILSLTRFTECEYSLILYLLNCAVSGLDELIATNSELSELIGYSAEDIEVALLNLHARKIVRMQYSDSPSSRIQSFSLGMQFNVDLYELDLDKDKISATEAIVFPFRSKDAPNLTVISSKRPAVKQKEGSQEETWKRIIHTFAQGRNLGPKELENAELSAKLLVETYPVDQILLMIRHFGAKIPTLSLLSSSWFHFQSQFDEEHHKINFTDARHKHRELDERLREQVNGLLLQADDLGFNDDEVNILNVLMTHRFPRRQLFWAYQIRSAYPHLSEFFKHNEAIMLAVTTTGHAVRKNTD